MEAPKEIYILKTKAPDGGLGISYHLYPIETKKTESIKYIRADRAVDKDALSEWAKEEQEQMKVEAGGCYNMLAAGKLLAFEEIIDKIESL